MKRTLLYAMLTMGLATAEAIETPPAPEVVPPEGEKKPSTLEGDSKESLLEGLIPAPSDDPTVELEAAASAMDRAATALDQQPPEAVIIDEQQAAIDHLRTLLKTASQQNSKATSRRSPDSKPTGDSPDQEPSKESASNGSNPQEGGQRRADDQNATQSSENVAGPNGTTQDSLAAGVQATAVWGHLPQRDQEAFMRTLTESVLPEYAVQIQDYYKAIAEGR